MSRRARNRWVPSPFGNGERRSARRYSATGSFPYSRRLRLEPLEDRRLLANVTVGNLTDIVDGNTSSIAALIGSPGADGGISLREAILAANVDNTDAADTIGFSVIGIIQLTNVLHVGEIVIDSNLTINGPGANVLTIRAFAGTVAAGDGARIFNVSNDSAVRTVSISGLTLTGGDVASILGGGAISNRENLTLTALTITGNSAGSATVGYHGGGIVNWGGNLTVNASTISGNTVLFGRGGGIYSSFGTMTISQSTISGNFVSSTGTAGGVYSGYTATLIDSSTISGNEANVGGGLVQKGIGTLMTVTNSTISENRARINGGGVVALYGNVNLRHTTITLNRADNDLNSTGNGGGVFVGPLSSNMSLDHTIVAGNTRGVSTRSDAFGTLAARYSLVGDNTGAAITNNGGNQIGTGASPINAMLAPDFDNGGPTTTHALLPGSPAIDAGDPSFAPPPANDQRGAPFVRVFDGDGAGGARIDIGAYERQTLSPSFFIVDTLVDELDGDYSPGDVSLREAVSAANGSPGADTISFATALTAGGPASIVLTKGELWIAESATIAGPGASLLTIDASGSDPTPAINNGDGSRILVINILFMGLPDTRHASISGLTFTGGDIAYANGYAIGGAIYNSDRLTLTGCVIRDNSADHGGGIGNRFAELEMIDCTVSGNSGREFGGGIYSAASDTTIRSSTISGNSAVVYGGGIAGGSPLIIFDSTISGNSAKYGGGIYGDPTVINCTIDGNMAHDGGGIYNHVGGTITIENSSISGNTVVDSGGGIYARLTTINISGSTLNNNTSNFNGGAIANESGPLTIADSTISGNTAHYGGGIYTLGSTFSLRGSTIHDNEAYFGGGIHCSVDNPTIESSTISGNRALFNGVVEGAGGGISLAAEIATIVNSTISGNSASGHGGGIEVSIGSQILLKHSTVTGNIADADGDLNGRGGGIHHGAPSDQYSDVELNHTIIARNNLINGARDDLFADVGAAYSLIGDNSGIGSFDDHGGNLVGTVLAPINPLLGPLADNGGPTLTHALLPGSQAIDAGKPGLVAGAGQVPFNDQRGDPFTRVSNGRIDIGAVERQAIPPAVFGDYNQNGVVDAADYVMWRKTFGTTGLPAYFGSDGDGDGMIGQGDYNVWRTHFGQTLGAGSTEQEAGIGVAFESLAGDPHPLENSRPLPEGEVRSRAAEPGTVEVRTTVRATPILAIGSPRIRTQHDQAAILRQDDVLLAWLALSRDGRRSEGIDEAAVVRSRAANEATNFKLESLAVAFEALAATDYGPGTTDCSPGS